MNVETDRKIEDILADQGKLAPGVVSKLKVDAINTGKSVEDLIISQNLVSEEVFVKAKSEYTSIPYIDLTDRTISADILSTVPESIARRYTMIPFEVDQANNSISVAMSDPLDLQLLEFLERKTSKKVKTFIATPSGITKAINEQYAQSLTSEVTEALKESNSVVEGEGVLQSLEKAEDVIREAPVAKIISTLIEYALKGRASDIHIEPLDDKTRIRFRIDGILQERLVIPKKVHEQLVTRVKILSSMKIDEKRLPQDGRFSFKLANDVIDLRVSSLPTVHGEKMVLRLLPTAGHVPSLSSLGLRGNGLKNIEEQVRKPSGIVLVVGPTGSGKTTTLFSILSGLNNNKVNIITVEDPVEYQIAGVNQVQINPAAGLTFASGLRSILRQDPNIIMVGEIRDRETTELAVQASLTGHLVFSTLHTNNAAGALPRLLDMGAEPFLLASSVNMTISQRVVRTLCESCKEPYDPADPVFEDIKRVMGSMLTCNGRDCKTNGAKDDHSHKIVLYRGKGCKECGESGYRGRTGIFEVMVVNDKISKMILEHASGGDIEKLAIEQGMMTMVQDGYQKALEGLTTIEEVLRVAHE